jgi:hypothetical protein
LTPEIFPGSHYLSRELLRVFARVVQTFGRGENRSQTKKQRLIAPNLLAMRRPLRASSMPLFRNQAARPLRNWGQREVGPTHGRMFRERPSAPPNEQETCPTVRAPPLAREDPTLNQASALHAEKYSIISRAISRSAMMTVLAPRLFRCSTSASEWARAIIWLFGLAARACWTTCPACFPKTRNERV